VLDLASALRALPSESRITLEVDWYLEPDEVVAGAIVLGELIDAG
jgi:hypothetical protein